MANVLHSTRTAANLHEPKDTASALAGQAYINKGVENAQWQTLPYSAMAAIGTAKPADTTLTAPVAYTALNVQGLETKAENGGVEGSNGPSLVYGQAAVVKGTIAYSVSLSHSDAALRNVFVTIAKNGVPLTNYELQMELAQNAIATFSDVVMQSMGNTDIFTIVAKVAAGNLLIKNAFAHLIGFPTH